MATGGEEEGRNALTILWRIENFSCLHRELHGNEIRSPDFHPRILDESCTNLCLGWSGESVDVGNVHLWLESVGICNLTFSVDWELAILIGDEFPLVTRRGTGTVKSLECSFRIMDFLQQEELFVTRESTLPNNDTLTVRCRVWKSEGNFPHNEFHSRCTRIEFTEDFIYWQIAGPSWCNLSQSASLNFGFDKYASFDLSCSLTVDFQKNPDLSILVTTDKIFQKFLAKLEVSILDNRQTEMKLGSAEHIFSLSEKKQYWAFPKSMLLENLRNRICVLKNGECINLSFRLTIVCKRMSESIEKIDIGISNLEENCTRTTSTFSEASCHTSERNSDTPPDPTSDTPQQRRNDCLVILGEDLVSQYQKQTFSDFELCSGDVCFPVHKVVLSARSPVFSSMFSSEMKESNSNSLDIPDLDAHALNRMLTFLYGGTVETDLPLESAAKLYYAADKYQVDSLKNMCSSILQSQISVSNVCDILSLADRHQDSDLTSFVYNFILSHFDEVVDSKEWEKFLGANPALAGKSMHQLYKKKRELKICPERNDQ